MRTIVEIPDSLTDEARRLAARQDTTLRVLIIEGLRKIVAERKHTGGFRLRNASFRGNGLQSDLAGAASERIRDVAYDEPGG